MLKPPEQEKQALQVVPAAFRRLCVETRHCTLRQSVDSPAAFRRLCVETANGRTYALAYASRLQAAVC